MSFPPRMGVIAQRTILDGKEPARSVVNDAEGDWAVLDGINDPNEPGACVLVRMSVLTDADPSLLALAAMERGTEAWREGPDAPWTFEPHAYADEDPAAAG
jgi:hypothetical protein